MKSLPSELAIRNQIKEEIGDEETITFLHRNMLSQKFGVVEPVILDGEVNYWEMRERMGDRYDRR